MDIFNTKKIAALEERIAALEPKTTVTGSVYATVSSFGNYERKPTLEDIEKRVKALEDEVGFEDSNPYVFRVFFGGSESQKLTLRRRVDRLCEHLKLQFVTEPQKTVIKPVKPVKAAKQ